MAYLYQLNYVVISQKKSNNFFRIIEPNKSFIDFIDNFTSTSIIDEEKAHSAPIASINSTVNDNNTVQLMPNTKK